MAYVEYNFIFTFWCFLRPKRDMFELYRKQQRGRACVRLEETATQKRTKLINNNNSINLTKYPEVSGLSWPFYTPEAVSMMFPQFDNFLSTHVT